MKKLNYKISFILLILIVLTVVIIFTTVNNNKKFENFAENISQKYNIDSVEFVRELKDYKEDYDIGIYKINVKEKDFLILGSPKLNDTNIHFILSSDFLFKNELNTYFNKDNYISKTFIYKNNNLWGESIKEDISIYSKDFFKKINFKEYNKDDRYHLNIMLNDDKMYTKEFLETFASKIKDKYSYNGVVMFYLTDKDITLKKYEEKFQLNYENPQIFDIDRKDFYIIHRFIIEKDNIIYEKVKNEK